MVVKVYNQSGKVKITKICGNGLEQTMFSDLKSGDEATIEISTSPYIKAEKRRTDKTANSEK